MPRPYWNSFVPCGGIDRKRYTLLADGCQLARGKSRIF
jgi:hypothetical protein